MLDYLFRPETLPFEIIWEAWATLGVGIAAVIGAFKIGIKQAKIAEKQTKILQSQVDQDRLQLRADLYDRRVAIYSAIKDYAFRASTGNAVPMDVQRPFYEALNASRFLFGPELQAWIQELHEVAIALQVFHQRAYGNVANATDEMFDRIALKQDELNRLLAQLDARFDPYLGFEEASSA